jgi:hypothetical protein
MPRFITQSSKQVCVGVGIKSGRTGTEIWYADRNSGKVRLEMKNHRNCQIRISENNRKGIKLKNV